MTQRIGIQRRVLLAAVLTASALALPGCARYYYGAAASSDPVDLMASNHGAADALLLQVPLDPGAPVLVGTVVQLDRLDESSRLGRLVAEQLAGRLVQRGLRVTELRMRLASQWLTLERLPIEEVAYRLGYTSQAAFSRAYKRITGQPPGASRQGFRSPA